MNLTLGRFENQRTGSVFRAGAATSVVSSGSVGVIIMTAQNGQKSESESVAACRRDQ